MSDANTDLTSVYEDMMNENPETAELLKDVKRMYKNCDLRNMTNDQIIVFVINVVLQTNNAWKKLDYRNELNKNARS